MTAGTIDFTQLVIALSLHQFIEGLSLSLCKTATMILLYTLVQLLTEELSKKNFRIKLLMYMCLLLGSGSMCALALAL
jgi:hypothetical protein